MKSDLHKQHSHLIAKYVTESQGLTLQPIEKAEGSKKRKKATVPTEISSALTIWQKADGKKLELDASQISEIIERQDQDGAGFLQLNFENGRKLLLTQYLIGFKPVWLAGLDRDRLPKVVTTPDLVSVLEAIQESLDTTSGLTESSELGVLKLVFESVLVGGEDVGFDMSQERVWIQQVTALGYKPSA